MQIKTIETIAGINKIDFGNNDHNTTAHFYWLKNLSDSTLYVSTKPNPITGADDVAELPVKGAVSIETDESVIYILGAGKVEIHRTDSKICPFRFPSSSSGDIEKSYAVQHALREAGYEVTDDPNTWGNTIQSMYKDYDYRLDYSGTIFVAGSNTVVRDTNKLAYCGWCTFNNGYFMPILISVYPEAVIVTMNGYLCETYTISIDGLTIHVSDCWQRSSIASDASDTLGYNRRYLGINTDNVAQRLYNEIKMLGYSLYE